MKWWKCGQIGYRPLGNVNGKDETEKKVQVQFYGMPTNLRPNRKTVPYETKVLRDNINDSSFASLLIAPLHVLRRPKENGFIQTRQETLGRGAPYQSSAGGLPAILTRPKIVSNNSKDTSLHTYNSVISRLSKCSYRPSQIHL
jgi:hypothetical protein